MANKVSRRATRVATLFISLDILDTDEKVLVAHPFIRMCTCGSLSVMAFLPLLAKLQNITDDSQLLWS